MIVNYDVVFACGHTLERIAVYVQAEAVAYNVLRIAGEIGDRSVVRQKPFAVIVESDADIADRGVDDYIACIGDISADGAAQCRARQIHCQGRIVADQNISDELLIGCAQRRRIRCSRPTVVAHRQ